MPKNIRPMPSNETRTDPSYGKTRHHAHHKHGGASAKLLRAFYRAKHGERPKTAQEAREWYAKLTEPKYRTGESQKRIAALEAAL